MEQTVRPSARHCTSTTYDAGSRPRRPVDNLVSNSPVARSLPLIHRCKSGYNGFLTFLLGVLAIGKP